MNELPDKNASVDEEANDEISIQYYTVSPDKFIVLFIVTFGLYSVYWFYKNWTLYKEASQENIWPVMRAIFSIFFVHSLFARIASNYKLRKGVEISGVSHYATVFVIFSILGNLTDRLAAKGIGMPLTMFGAVISLPILCWSVYKVQLLVNISNGDEEGFSNSKFTLKNTIWIVLGAILWMFTLLGFYQQYFRL